MSSYFDSIFCQFAAPTLMEHMGSAQAITIVLGSTTLVDQADCIIRHETTFDEELQDGTLAKKIELQVDLLIEEGTDHGGLSGNFTNAHALLEGRVWSIDRIGNRTKTFQRLVLVSKAPRNMVRSGFNRGQ